MIVLQNSLKPVLSVIFLHNSWKFPKSVSRKGALLDSLLDALSYKALATSSPVAFVWGLVWCSNLFPWAQSRLGGLEDSFKLWADSLRLIIHEETPWFSGGFRFPNGHFHHSPFHGKQLTSSLSKVHIGKTFMWGRKQVAAWCLVAGWG